MGSGDWEHFVQEDGPSASKMRMNFYQPTSFEQLLELPDGTEVALFTLAPMMLGLQCVTLLVGDKMREQTQGYIDADTPFTFAFGIYILPDNLVPEDPSVLDGIENGKDN